ncbi:MAG: hypothetical protein A3I26_00055 [Candidatus Yanofskybacteria bacterium RIFCSPLOWO2_02_FULL_43_10]|nr:MAG: hypothetical protein A3C69_02195 [Candidatus Yanofskybacteria bacterium RIFCSPHIGHO2_02_FULL_43_12]OGN29268.1 MAG: hypothetical protein A3I26_00055 [Candidatus Yanofskybacteria bacterium RIFCSPLOWO2_02_FULL_43_10]
MRSNLSEFQELFNFAPSHIPPTRPIVQRFLRSLTIYMLGISKNQAEMPAQVLPVGMWLEAQINGSHM